MKNKIFFGAILLVAMGLFSSCIWVPCEEDEVEVTFVSHITTETEYVLNVLSEEYYGTRHSAGPYYFTIQPGQAPSTFRLNEKYCYYNNDFFQVNVNEKGYANPSYSYTVPKQYRHHLRLQIDVYDNKIRIKEI